MGYTMYRWCGSALLCCAAFAGQSVVTVSGAGNYPANFSVPNWGNSATLRTEMRLENWPDSPAGQVYFAESAGTYGNFASTVLQITSYKSQSYSNGPFAQIGPLPAVKVMYIRIQRNPGAAVGNVPASSETVEAWDYQGNRFYSNTVTFVDRSDTGQGIYVGGVIPINAAFFRVHSTLVQLNSRPPLISDNADALIHWKFDGNLNDSSGANQCGGGPCNGSGGNVSYATTQYVGPSAKIKTANAPVWTDTATLRAGHSNGLDGSASYSQSDSSATVSCAWSLLSGPSSVTFSNASSCTPDVTGLIFGDYHFQLIASDTNGNATATAHIGAVYTDDNWVVQPADANVTKIFGPMIAWGHNPWGAFDYLAMWSHQLRYAQYTAALSVSVSNPGFGMSSTYPYSTWETNQAGTVTYRWGGVGMDYTSAAGTTITSSIAESGTTTFDVADISKIDTSGLPATPIRVYIWRADSGGWEEIRISAVSGSTLTILGRGSADSNTSRLAARAWASGSYIGQFRVNGSGTSFGSTICANSPNRSAILHFTRGDGVGQSSDAYIHWDKIAGCEGDTAAYLMPQWDVSIYGVAAGQLMSAKNYSYIDNFSLFYNQGSRGGLNFYGEDLAHRALYYRSGLDSARLAADMIGDIWAKMSGGACQNWYLFCGGWGIGGFADAVLSTSANKLTWPDLRILAKQGLSTITALQSSCAAKDSRDAGYALSWFSLAALFDPDTTSTVPDSQSGGWSGYWRRQLSTMLSVEQTCKQSDNSWQSGAPWATTGGWVGQEVQLTMSNGSAVATGTGIPDTVCLGTASGTGSATHGSGVITGTGFVTGGRIAITGTSSSQPFTAWLRFTRDSSSQITLANGATWTGDTGSITWMIESSDGSFLVLGQSNDDGQLAKAWSCIKNSSSQITLHKSWDGASEVYWPYRYNVAGFSQQPYMLGIRQRAWQWAALAATASGDATTAAGFETLRGLAGAWQNATGYDASTNGFYYGVQSGCTPMSPASSGQGTCYSDEYGTDYNKIAERELSGENMSSLRAYYDSGAGDAITWGDTVYGSLWGDPAYTTGGAHTVSDGQTEIRSTMAAYADTGLGFSSGKWTGFHFGVGMGHEWPAIRLADIPGVQYSGRKVGGRIRSGGRVR